MSGIVGQNTLGGSGLVKSPEGGGAWNFIKNITITSDTATASFVNGTSDVVLDSTYKTYVFTITNYQSAGNGDTLSVNFSTDTGSNYNATKTTSLFRAKHGEDDSPAEVAYDARSQDLYESTDIVRLNENGGNGSDESVSGFLWLFDPSNTTFLKHFWARVSSYNKDDNQEDIFTHGYCNTTDAVDAVQFGSSVGFTNIGACEISLYGISNS